MSLLEKGMSLLERYKERFGKRDEGIGESYEIFRKAMRELE
jgi:hypothetical protein